MCEFLQTSSARHWTGLGSLKCTPGASVWWYLACVRLNHREWRWKFFPSRKLASLTLLMEQQDLLWTVQQSKGPNFFHQAKIEMSFSQGLEIDPKIWTQRNQLRIWVLLLHNQMGEVLWILGLFEKVFQDPQNLPKHLLILDWLDRWI